LEELALRKRIVRRLSLFPRAATDRLPRYTWDLASLMWLDAHIACPNPHTLDSARLVQLVFFESIVCGAPRAMVYRAVGGDMRIVAVTLACTLAIGSAISVVSAQSSRQNEFVSALPGDGQLLWNEGRILCVPANMANSLISNPLKITVIVNSADDIQIDWELDDGGGKLLEAVSQYDDYDSQNPVWSTSRAVLVQGFISRPSESERGTLTISPSRYTIGNGTEDLPKLRIPVRLTTATTTITILTPADPKSVRRRSCHLDGFSNRSRQL
jgi:hypothetical protein